MFGGLLGLWALVAIRIFAILRVQPQWRLVIGPWWWAVAAVLALVLAPLATHTPLPELGLLEWIGLALLELLLGTVLGLLVSLTGHALIGAATASGLALGLRSPSPRAFVSLCVCLVLALGLATGLHRALIGALVASTKLWPPGSPALWYWSEGEVVAEIIAAAYAMTVLALALATPVLLTAAVADLATRLLGRGSDPAAALSDALRPWLRTAGALIALGASWAAYPEAWVRGLG